MSAQLLAVNSISRREICAGLCAAPRMARRAEPAWSRSAPELGPASPSLPAAGRAVRAGAKRRRSPNEFQDEEAGRPAGGRRDQGGRDGGAPREEGRGGGQGPEGSQAGDGPQGSRQ